MNTSTRFSWTIAEVRGIPIRLHPTFLIIPMIAALTFGRAHGAAGALFGVLLTALLFASVALHELGHSIVAQRFGVAVKDITLYPIGGVAAIASQDRHRGRRGLVAVPLPHHRTSGSASGGSGH